MPENTGSFEFGTVAVKLESIAAQITRMDVKIDHVVATQSKQGERLAVAEARLAQHSEASIESIARRTLNSFER